MSQHAFCGSPHNLAHTECVRTSQCDLASLNHIEEAERSSLQFRLQGLGIKVYQLLQFPPLQMHLLIETAHFMHQVTIHLKATSS